MRHLLAATRLILLLGPIVLALGSFAYAALAGELGAQAQQLQAEILQKVTAGQMTPAEANDLLARKMGRDGRRFLGLIDATQAAQSVGAQAPRIQVVLNWFEELKAKVPTK